jgi:hypothetical protein
MLVLLLKVRKDKVVERKNNMSKYNLTDILNEYVGGSRHGTINISYRDLQDAMDKIEADGDFVVRELSGPSGDGKVNREFEVVFIGAARGDNKQEEAGFTVYDYKFGFDPASENNFDEVLPFSIGGSNKEAALKIAKYLLGNRVQGYMARDKDILKNFDPKDINDVLFSFESNTDEEGEFKTSMGFNEENVGKDLAKADEVIKIIKMMNPDVRADLLMRIARMGQKKINEGDLVYLNDGDLDFIKSIVARMEYDKDPIEADEFSRLKQILQSTIREMDENRRVKNPVGMGQLYVQPSVQKEVKRQLDAYDKGDIDINDLVQGIEDIIFGHVKAPTDEVMGIDRLGREKPETEPTDLSRAKMKLREDMRRFRNAVKDVSGISDEDKEELARTLARFSLTNFTKSDKGDVFFHDKNTIQQLGKRSKAYADKIGISSNTPYFNSIEYYEKQQFSQVKDFIKNRLQVARLGLKAVMSGAYTDEEVAVYKPLLQDQVAMLMQLDDMDNNALEDLFRRNPSTDKEWQELFRRHPKGNLDKKFKFKTDTDIKSINSKKPNITADDEIDAELGNALANLDRDEDYERLMKAVEKLRDKGKDDEAFSLQRRGERMYGRRRGRDGRYYDEERIDEGFVKQMYTILSDYGSPMEINTYMDSLGNEFRLSPDSKDKYDDFSEDDWVEDFRVYIDDKSLQEHFRRFNIKKYS